MKSPNQILKRYAISLKSSSPTSRIPTRFIMFSARSLLRDIIYPYFQASRHCAASVGDGVRARNTVRARKGKWRARNRVRVRVGVRD